MLFNYTTHFLVLYYFSSSSPPKVRGVREELKLFLFYFFISTFYISLKKIRMLEIYPHLFLFLPQKNGGKFEKDSYLFQISHHVFFNHFL